MNSNNINLLTLNSDSGVCPFSTAFLRVTEMKGRNLSGTCHESVMSMLILKLQSPHEATSFTHTLMKLRHIYHSPDTFLN